MIINITDTIIDCPAHLQPALLDARARWGKLFGEVDFRPHQAAEVLHYAADCFESRMWGEAEHLAAAELGAWLAAAAIREDRERKGARAQPAPDLGPLSAEEIQMIHASRAKGAVGEGA